MMGSRSGLRVRPLVAAFLGAALAQLGCESRRTEVGQSSTRALSTASATHSAPSSSPTGASTQPASGAGSLASRLQADLHRCVTADASGGTRELKEQLHQSAACTKALSDAEVNKRGYDTLKSLVGAFAEDFCSLSEDSSNFDFPRNCPALTGSLFGVEDMDCSRRVSGSMYLMLATARVGSSDELKLLLESQRGAGVAALSAMAKREATVKSHKGKTQPPFDSSACDGSWCPPYVTHDTLVRLFARTGVSMERLAVGLCASLLELRTSYPKASCVEVTRAYLASSYHEG
jgi:hypothetical protein